MARAIPKPDRAAIRHQRHLQHVGLGSEGAGHAQRQIFGARVDDAGRAHHVLRRDGVEDLAVIQTHRRHPVGLEFDQNLFVLHPDPVDAADPVDLSQQVGPHDIHLIAQLAVAEPVGGEGIDDAEDIAEIIGEERPQHALRQGVADIPDAVAHFLPGARHGLGRDGVLKIDIDGDDARPRDRPHRLQAGGLFQRAFQPVGQLAFGFGHRGPRPDGGDQHGLQREGRVFIAPQVDEGEGTGDHRDDHHVDGKLAAADGPFRKVGANHAPFSGSRTT